MKKIEVSNQMLLACRIRIANYINLLLAGTCNEGRILNGGESNAQYFKNGGDGHCCEEMDGDYEVIKVSSYLFKHKLDSKREALKKKYDSYDIQHINEDKTIDYNIFKEFEDDFVKNLDNEISSITNKYPNNKIFSSIIVSKTFIELTLFV